MTNDAEPKPKSVRKRDKPKPAARLRLRPRRFGVGHRDWWAMLMPIFITVGISMVANVAVGIWQGATFKAQVQHIDQHQTEQDKAISDNSAALRTMIERLPIDYVPRVEHEKNSIMEKEVRDMDREEMKSLESKIDTILENTARTRSAR